jgi:hypothetical protein
VSSKKKLTARKKLLDSEEEKVHEEEEGEGEQVAEQREMETDSVPVAGPSGLTRPQVSSSKYFFSVSLILHLCCCNNSLESQTLFTEKFISC